MRRKRRSESRARSFRERKFRLEDDDEKHFLKLVLTRRNRQLHSALVSVTSQRNMPKLDALLAEHLRSELMLQQQLKALSEALRQQLQEADTRQKEELDRRIHQNSLLSTESADQNTLKQAKHVGMRRSISTSALTSGKNTLQHPRQPESPDLSSPAWVSSKWKDSSDRAPMLTPARPRQCERLALSKTTQLRKEEEAEAECQRKFCAHPVPSHVIQPLYQKMMELKEKDRNQAHEQRRDFLLSIQKPFSFQEREKEKKEKLIMLNQVSHKNKAATVRKPLQKVVEGVSDSELKVQELCSRVRTQTSERQTRPTLSGSPKLRTAERTRKEKLDEKPSFQPKIIHRVPDFSRLHRALQTEALRKSQSKDVMRCQPFNLRTSALPARRRRMSPENPQVPKANDLSRSKSLGALTSLSANTLPTFITDATRKRCTAIRKSMEMRDSKNQESADWLRKYRTRSQAMKKTVALHARLLDPHSSLKDVFDDKLQHHREADQEKTRAYTRELRDMKARVGERPFLFEQVKQKTAKAQAEQTFRNKLKKAGLKEQFVEENGEAVEGTSSSFSSNEDTDENHRTDNHICSREENGDDGEKIEDVEEKSMKSKGEEMP
ncbi:protein FAM161B isoform X2 [Pseudoliparis swirei]|uniref:protein FAM161B isoform X2 n=1 Tax=Pseudoliparis swirei TaxID=2059687 RepID=UPI0024BEE907|nr:protein FAM161B isoform X2 [Pseudoliparis swirei]